MLNSKITPKPSIFCAFWFCRTSFAPPTDNQQLVTNNRCPMRDLWKTPPFAQPLRQAQILILKILNVFLRLKFSPSLALNKIEHFSKVSWLMTNDPSEMRYAVTRWISRGRQIKWNKIHNNRKLFSHNYENSYMFFISQAENNCNKDCSIKILQTWNAIIF